LHRFCARVQEGNGDAQREYRKGFDEIADPAGMTIMARRRQPSDRNESHQTE
jgi:hypothetical protein